MLNIIRLSLTGRHFHQALAANIGGSSLLQRSRDIIKHHSAYHEDVVLGLFLNNRYEIICSELLAKGSHNHVNIYPREIVRRTLYHSAGGLIIAHNHPSGTAKASDVDIKMTQTLQQALKLMDIQLIDHFIVAGHRMISFADLGLL